MRNYKVSKEKLIEGINPDHIDLDSIDNKTMYKLEKRTERVLKKLKSKTGGDTDEQRRD